PMVLLPDVLRFRALAKTHQFQRAAEHLLIEVESGLALAIEYQVGVDFHQCSPLSSLPRRTRRRSSCSRNSGVKASPKSSVSKICRISISESPGMGLGQRFTHSMHACSELT